MNTQKSLNFISKAVEKTKKQVLTWETIPSNKQIKLLPEESANLMVSVLSQNGSLDIKNSYMCKYKSGEILLLAYASSAASQIISSPPDGYILSLRVQDMKSKYSIEISNSGYDPTEADALIRLYNLIDKESSTLNFLINDFLNS